MTDNQTDALRWLMGRRGPFTSAELRWGIDVSARQARRAVAWALQVGLIELWDAPDGRRREYHSLIRRVEP